MTTLNATKSDLKKSFVGKTLRHGVFAAVCGVFLSLSQGALAEVDDSLNSNQNDVRGMLVVKIPIGVDGGASGTPSYGVDIQMQKNQGQELRKDRFDPHTGARLSDSDLEDVRTWNFEKLDAVKPVQETNRPIELNVGPKEVHPDDPS